MKKLFKLILITTLILSVLFGSSSLGNTNIVKANGGVTPIQSSGTMELTYSVPTSATFPSGELKITINLDDNSFRYNQGGWGVRLNTTTGNHAVDTQTWFVNDGTSPLNSLQNYRNSSGMFYSLSTLKEPENLIGTPTITKSGIDFFNSHSINSDYYFDLTPTVNGIYQEYNMITAKLINKKSGKFCIVNTGSDGENIKINLEVPTSISANGQLDLEVNFKDSSLMYSTDKWSFTDTSPSGLIDSTTTPLRYVNSYNHYNIKNYEEVTDIYSPQPARQGYGRSVAVTTMNSEKKIYLSAEGVKFFSEMLKGNIYKFHNTPQKDTRETRYNAYIVTPLNFKVKEITKQGDCGGGASIKSCPEGTVAVRDSNGNILYCNQVEYVKQTEFEKSVFMKDVNFEDLFNQGYGSSGDRSDGQFNLDSGNHNNGWHLNGAGDAYKSNHVQFTNIPDNGYVNAIGGSWSPEYLITQGKLKLPVPKPHDATTIDAQKRDTDLNSFKSTKSLSEVLTYKVTDLEKLKQIQSTEQGLTDLFTKTGSTYKYASEMTSQLVGPQGEESYDALKIKDSGYYIVASKFIDMASATKEQTNPSQETITKHTYYSFVPVSVNFMTDLGYLPVYNNLLAQINDNMLMVGNKKANHKLGNLAYQTYKSMKVPSSFNHKRNKTLIGSPSGGLQLLNKELAPITIKDNTGVIASAKVNDIIEHSDGFYVATDGGILYLNCETNELSETDITTPVNDLEVNYDIMYYLTDDTLSTTFVTDSELVENKQEYDIASMFESPTTKAGRVEVVGSLITVSSKDDSTESEVVTLAK